jgi:hypothetical protein
MKSVRFVTARRIELGMIIGFLAYLTATKSLINIPLCLSRTLGLPCPTCGTTRSLWHLLHGNFGEAWTANPIGYIALLVLARRAFVLSLPHRPAVRLLEHLWLDLGLLASYLAFGALRMMGIL